jgi:hypothetical protein
LIKLILLLPPIVNSFDKYFPSIIILSGEPLPRIIRFLFTKFILLSRSVFLLYVPGFKVIVFKLSLPLLTLDIALLIPPESLGLIVISTALTDEIEKSIEKISSEYINICNLGYKL